MNDSQPLRLSMLGIVAVALFTALFARLWFLQVMAAPEYQVQAEINRTRTIVVEGPRGRILDRNGKVLAQNRESIVVTVQPQVLNSSGHADDALITLARELTLAGNLVTVNQLRSRIDDWLGDPYRPVVVAEDVNPELWVTLSERTAVLPGVGVERTLVREYPYGSLAAHVLGYVGEINSDELAQVRDSPKPYRAGDTIGKAGVEQMFEGQLRGEPGSITFEVDSMNRIVGIVDRVAPEPGSDLQLTVDIDLQGVTERALDDELRRARSRGDSSAGRTVTAPAGAVTVLGADTGEVLAMASHPTFDPNELVRGVSTQRWEELVSRENYSPLSNRAIREPYAPGSTFKLISGYTAAASGLRSPGFAINDTGRYTLIDCEDRCTFSNPGSPPAAYGMVDLRRALTVSSNVYFYQIGEAFWRARNTYGEQPIQDFGALMGLGAQTGVALPLEHPGILMSPELKRQRHEDNPEVFPYGQWLTGDSVNLAIGQADIGITPIQLANAYATFGNGGTLRAPNVALAVIDPTSGETLQSFGPRVVREVELVEPIRQVVVEGLLGVTQSNEGTGARVFAGFPHAQFPVAGKTGTAQVTGKADSSLFAAWAPAAAPRYAISVVVEEGGYGSRVAAPIARRVLEPLAERDIDGVPLVAAPLWNQEAVGEDASEIEVGGALN